jgi:hypothetical protein
VNTATPSATPKADDPVRDLDRYRRFLQWIFLTDCGRRRRAGIPLLMALPEPRTVEQHAAARKAYLQASGRVGIFAISPVAYHGDRRGDRSPSQDARGAGV